MGRILNALVLFLLFETLCLAQNTDIGCPELKLVGPAGIVEPGERVIFLLEFDKAIDTRNLEFEWSVEQGEIITGDKTSRIKVISTERGATVNVSVRVKGLLSECQNIATTTAYTGGIGHPIPSDEYGKLSWSDERARLDAFFVELSNDPSFIGALYIHEQSIDFARRHMQKILKHARFREMDKRRLVFLLGTDEEPKTVLWRSLVGAELPTCDGCEIYKGSNL